MMDWMRVGEGDSLQMRGGVLEMERNEWMDEERMKKGE